MANVFDPAGSLVWDDGCQPTMSKRRHSGDWVWLKPNTGFVGESNRLKVQIQHEEDSDAAPCIFDDCKDPACREWYTLWTLPDPEANGKRHVLCHVSECRMSDERIVWPP